MRGSTSWFISWYKSLSWSGCCCPVS